MNRVKSSMGLNQGLWLQPFGLGLSSLALVLIGSDGCALLHKLPPRLIDPRHLFEPKQTIKTY
ncbi:hypothetical protein HanRHA438_Chr16g0737771 [Helianthus annuus]|nr:hypothetical protein HanRHA438_Chr16g0737771 [Helianthus annuus]